MSNITEVNDENFDAVVLQADRPVLVDFWAGWCSPCRAVGPIIDDLADKYSDKVDVVKVDIDENRAISSTYGVITIPAVFVFKDGEVVARCLGAKPKAVYERELAEFLK